MTENILYTVKLCKIVPAHFAIDYFHLNFADSFEIQGVIKMASIWHSALLG